MRYLRCLLAGSTTRRSLAALLLVSVVVRGALIWAARDVEPRIVDEQHYVQLATSLVNGDGFAWEAGRPTSLRPPLYPAFIAAVWTVTGTQSLTPVRIVQLVLATLSILLLYDIGRRMFDERTALVAAALFGFYPSLLFSGVLMLAETLFITLFLAAVRALTEVIEHGSARHAIIAGAAIGLAALTRSILWPLPIVLVPALAIVVRQPVAVRAIACAALLAGYTVTVGPWAIRNTRLQGTPTIVDTMGGVNLRTGNYEFTPEDRMWDGVSLQGPQSWAAPLAERSDAARWTEGQKERWARDAALAYMLDHPATTVRRSVLKLADLWGLEREWLAGLNQGLYRPPAWFAAVSGALVVGVYPGVLLLAVCAMVALAPADRRLHWLVLLLVAYTSALHGLTFGHSRYHLPLIPLLACYAAATIVNRRELIGSWRAHRYRMATALASALCLAVWLRELAFRDAGHLASLLTLLGYQL